MKHELQCDAFAAMETATASFDAGEELEDLGLSRQFYDTQFDFPKFQADEYADKFLLGVSVRMRRPLYMRASMHRAPLGRPTPSTRCCLSSCVCSMA